MKKLISVLLVLAVICTLFSGLTITASASVSLMTAQDLARRDRLLALKAGDYPEGTPHDNCRLFASECQHVVFEPEAETTDIVFIRNGNFTYDDIHVGTHLRLENPPTSNYPEHSVVVLEKYDDKVVLVEGNWLGIVHWGRTLSKEKVMQAIYIDTPVPAEFNIERGEVTAPYEVTSFKHFAFSLKDKNGNLLVRDRDYSVIFRGWDGDHYNENITPCEPGTYRMILTGMGKYYGEKDFYFDIQTPTIAPFNDVPDDEYYAEPVRWAVENGITQGTDDLHFSPNDPCTRAQVVTFLWRANGCPAPKTKTCPFTDVKHGAYYEKAVLWAVENEITAGTGKTKFSPNDPCTRAQVVTFLWRTAGMPKVSANNPFRDIAANEYYYKAVLWAVGQKITSGTSKTKFSPNDTCTRGQIVTFLSHAYAK